jgi:hypothetical protein
MKFLLFLLYFCGINNFYRYSADPMNINDESSRPETRKLSLSNSAKKRSILAIKSERHKIGPSTPEVQNSNLRLLMNL